MRPCSVPASEGRLHTSRPSSGASFPSRSSAPALRLLCCRPAAACSSPLRDPPWGTGTPDNWNKLSEGAPIPSYPQATRHPALVARTRRVRPCSPASLLYGSRCLPSILPRAPLPNPWADGHGLGLYHPVPVVMGTVVSRSCPSSDVGDAVFRFVCLCV
jgi:hypothetical protein